MKSIYFLFAIALVAFSSAGRADDEIPLAEREKSEFYEQLISTPLLLNLVAHQLSHQPLTAPYCSEKSISLHSGVSPTCVPLAASSEGLLVIQTYCRISGIRHHVRVEVCVDAQRNILPLTVRSEQSRVSP